MLVTEQEAEEKWCPHTIIEGSPSSYNRNSWGAEPKIAGCIGSRCMSWRWATDPLVNFVANGHATNIKTEYGYCGLAGKL